MDSADYSQDTSLRGSRVSLQSRDIFEPHDVSCPGFPKCHLPGIVLESSVSGP